MKEKRPTSVTALCWILFLLAGISLNSAVRGISPEQAAALGDGLSAQLAVTAAVLAALLQITFGVFMLRGANWARWALLTYLVVGLVASIGLGNVIGGIVGAAKTGLFAYFLTRRDAVAFFRPSSIAPEAVQAQPTVPADDHASRQ